MKKNKTQKVHRERSQPEDRRHLGFLQKKKDYKQRANHYQHKKSVLQKLRRQAEDRNPDEFYFRMTRTKKDDGGKLMHREGKEPVVTDDQRKLMATQDKKYVTFRLAKELKKIEKLKKSLHMIDSTEKKNKHTVFVDSDKEAKEFDAAKFFDTHPAFLDRAYNRPKLDALKSGKFTMDQDLLESAMAGKDEAYKKLEKRIDRARELKIVLDKLDAKMNGMDKREKTLVKEETKQSAAVYKFFPMRQK